MSSPSADVPPSTRPPGRWLETLGSLLAVGLLLLSLVVLVAAWGVVVAAVERPWPAWRPQVQRLGLSSLVWGVNLVALLLTGVFARPRVFGPVLGYELVRMARRGRYFLVRVLYALLLLATLFLVYLNTTHWESTEVRASEAAQFGNIFFVVFMTIQFLAVVLLTPAYAAGAIAEEKERKTLEFLLATELLDREIVLSKLAARLLNVLLLVLGGLPILAALQFMGGVEPLLVITGFAATAMTAASLVGLSLYQSTVSRRARDAIVLTYLMAIAYLVVSGMSMMLLIPKGWDTFPENIWPNPPFTLKDILGWINAGNVFTGLYLVGEQVDKGTQLTDAMLPLFRNYALFHGVVALATSVGALLRLRPIALGEIARVSGTTTSQRGRGPRRRPVSDSPLVWKEVYLEGGFRLNRAGRILIRVLVPMSFVPSLIISIVESGHNAFEVWAFVLILGLAPLVIGMLFLAGRRGQGFFFSLMLFLLFLFLGTVLHLAPSGRFSELSEAINIYQVRLVGGLVSLILLAGVAVRAAGSISGERDRQTLDELLTTPLDSDSILLGKWLGAVASVRQGLLWLGAIWLFGIVTGGMHVAALPGLVLTWFVYAGFVATLGLWYSIQARTTLRAMTSTLGTAAVLGVGHWLIYLCCAPCYALGSFEVPQALERLGEWIVYSQIGITPPAALGGLLPFTTKELGDAPSGVWNAWRNVDYALSGALFWAIMTTVLARATSDRFRELTLRGPRQPAVIRSQNS